MNNVILKRWDITNVDGWKRLSEESVIVKGMFEALGTTVSIRWKGGPSILLRNNGNYPVDGVDLYDFEISTSSVTSVGFVVFCQTR